LLELESSWLAQQGITVTHPRMRRRAEFVEKMKANGENYVEYEMNTKWMNSR
jgi:hypothetical protein